jgi:hypothetical protein
LAALIRDKAKRAVDVVRAPEPVDEGEGGGTVIDILEVLRRRLGVRERAVPPETPAARTVSARRSKQGRTKPNASKANGNPRGPLQSRTKDELHSRAQELKIDGRSQMTTSELVAAIRALG